MFDSLSITERKGASFLNAWYSLGLCEHSAWSASRPVALWHFCGVVLLLGITLGPLAITGSVVDERGNACGIALACSFTLLSLQGLFM